MGIGYIYISECVSCAILFFFLKKERKKKKDPERPSPEQWQSVYCHRAHATVSIFSVLYTIISPKPPTIRRRKKKEKNPSILSLSVFLLDLFPPTFFLSLPQLLLRLKKMTFGLILMNQSQHTRIHQTIFRRN